MNRIDAQWWLQPEGQKHETILSLVRHFRNRQAKRKTNDLLNSALYENDPALGGGGDFQAAIEMVLRQQSGLSLNVIRNMVDTATAKIAAKAKPRPMFLTEGGSVENQYELKEKAELCEKFVSGVFYESGVYAELPHMFRDAAVWGTGALKIYEADGRVCVDRIDPREFVVDENEARHGERNVRSLYQRQYWDRQILRSKYASDDDDLAKKIDGAIESDEREHLFDDTADQLLVTEAWRLPDGPGLPGRHCIVIEACTLVDEPWEETSFPFAFFRWNTPLRGFFGVGLAQELRSIQVEINKLLQQIQRAHHMIQGHWFAESGAKLTSGSISNDIAAVIKWSGVAGPPVFNAPVPIAPTIYQHLWDLYQKAYEIAGISQLNASGVKPSGLNSAPAQRAFQDITSERFTRVFADYDDCVIECARQVVRIVSRVGSYKVKALGKDDFRKLKWKEVRLDDDDFVLKVYPAAFLPTTPAGKLAFAQDLINMKVVSPAEMLELLEMPDTEAYLRRKNAPKRIIQRNIAHMLRTGQAITPEPYDNHKLALQMVSEAYAEARLDMAPEDRLARLREYLAATEDYIAQANPPPPPPPPPQLAPGPMGPMNGASTPMPPAGPGAIAA